MRDPTTWNGWMTTPTVLAATTNLLGLNVVATQCQRTWVTEIREKECWQKGPSVPLVMRRHKARTIQ